MTGLSLADYRAQCTPQAGLLPCVHRVVTSERKPYPCFTEDDFPAVYKAAQSALKSAQQAAVADSTSMVPPTEPALFAS